MRIDELSWNEIRGWSRHNANVVRDSNGGARKTNLVLYFGIREALANGSRYQELRMMYPDAHIVGCSTGGQIRNDDVSDDEISAATLSFDATDIRLAGYLFSRPCRAEDLLKLFPSHYEKRALSA